MRVPGLSVPARMAVRSWSSICTLSGRESFLATETRSSSGQLVNSEGCELDMDS
jgi:hypothetical protein